MFAVLGVYSAFGRFGEQREDPHEPRGEAEPSCEAWRRSQVSRKWPELFDNGAFLVV